MIRTILHVLTTRRVTPTAVLPELPPYARGLPTVTAQPCAAESGCQACVDVCPTAAITIVPAADRPSIVALDRGRCIACGLCVPACPTGTLAESRSTRVAVRSRAALVETNRTGEPAPAETVAAAPFRRSIHIREVSTGDNAADLEVAASLNPLFDGGRFGIHFVASPRYADALVVTGPVGRAMKSPLQRCYEAMTEPRMVIAVGCAAISGGLHAGGYAGADGVDAVLPVDVFVPGNPPHPWMILHGILLAMDHPLARQPREPAQPAPT